MYAPLVERGAAGEAWDGIWKFETQDKLEHFHKNL